MDRIASHVGMRGFAAFLVLIFHLQFGLSTVGLPKIEVGRAFIDHGYLWVDLFFILSGFILFYSATPDGKALPVPSIPRFYWARLTRIVPLHWFCLGAVIVIQGAIAAFALWKGEAPGPHWSLGGLGWTLQEFLLLNVWSLPNEQTWNGPDWSISAEMVAYLLFPLLTVVLSRRAGIALLLIASVAYYSLSGTLHVGVGLQAVARCLSGFVLGMALAHNRNIWTKLSDNILTLLQLLAAVGAALVFSLSLNDALVIPLFVIMVGSTWTDRGLVARGLSSAPMQVLGEISYSLYLVHWTVLLVVGQVWIHAIGKLALSQPVGQMLWAATFIAMSLVCAGLTNRYIEIPCRRHFKRRRDRVGFAGLAQATR